MAASGKPLFDTLLDYEQRSVHHDSVQAGERGRPGNWDGVVFKLGDRHLTCSIESVEEILPFPQPTPVPGARDWLLGLANVRGNLVTVVDLGWYLFNSRSPVTSRTRLILTRLQGRFVGLMVDEVFGQRHFHSADLETEAENSEMLDGLVQGHFPQGSARWGVFRLDELMRRASFLDGAA